MEATTRRTRRGGVPGPSEGDASPQVFKSLLLLSPSPAAPPVGNVIEAEVAPPRTTRARTQLQRREDAGPLLQCLPAELLSLVLSHLSSESLTLFAPLCQALWLAV